MRSNLIIKYFTIASLPCLLFSCDKKEEQCNTKLVPLVTSNSPVTAGDSLKLFVSGINVRDVFMYNWHGPNGFSSHDSTPALPGASSAYNGKYYVDVITNSGCIYTGVSDSVQVGAMTVPCTLTNNTADISGAATINFYYITAGPNGGNFVLTANGDNGDATIEFAGTNPPPIGIYSVQPQGGAWGAGYAHVSFTAISSYWDGSPGTVYVSRSNGKVVVSSCSTKVYSSTWSFGTSASFQLTQP